MGMNYLKKDKNKSVRINKDILALIEARGLTLQAYLDLKLDDDFAVKLEDLKIVTEDCKHKMSEARLERALQGVME